MARIVTGMCAGSPGPSWPVGSVADALARMEQIQQAEPAADGLACFNRMYLEVTRSVSDRLGQGFFADPGFMTQLDVAFANLYFQAADAAAQSAQVPLAWQPLVQARANPQIEPIQFALAGMNAHINHDLPLAVVETCAALNTEPSAGSHLADYQKVDQLLDAAEQQVRQSFESAPELAADRHLQAVASLVANWTINTARDLAWTNAILLWAMRDNPPASRLLAGAMAASTAQSSRLLLVTV